MSMSFIMFVRYVYFVRYVLLSLCEYTPCYKKVSCLMFAVLPKLLSNIKQLTFYINLYSP